MGLLKGLALLPLAPVEGVVWIARQIQAEVDRQALDPEAVMEQLRELQREVDEGRITEEQYEAAEEELLDRLDALQVEEGTE
jgi:cytochrome c-type biogenesis protein CcmI